MKDMAKVFAGLPKEVQRRMIETMKKEPVAPTCGPELMTDQELCDILGISPTTLRKHLREGPPRKTHPQSLDIRLLKPIVIGKIRRWNRRSVFAFLNGEG